MDCARTGAACGSEESETRLPSRVTTDVHRKRLPSEQREGENVSVSLHSSEKNICECSEADLMSNTLSSDRFGRLTPAATAYLLRIFVAQNSKSCLQVNKPFSQCEQSTSFHSAAFLLPCPHCLFFSHAMNRLLKLYLSSACLRSLWPLLIAQ